MARTRGSRRASKLRSPLWAKILVGLGSVLMVGSLGTVTYIEYMLNAVNDAVGQECLVGDCSEDEPVSDLKGPFNMLLIGSDMRKDWSAAQADSIMIVHVNADLTGADIISIPRDLLVDIPDCGEHWGHAPCENKINHAFAAGGTDMKAAVSNLAATLSDLMGIEIDMAGMINFGGFQDVVELLGGVELCVPFDMTLAHPEGTEVKKGCKEYEPEIALGIVRERYSYDPSVPGWKEEYGIGDYGRQRMQQHFIKQLLKKAKDEGYLTDVTKIGTLIEAIGDQLLLDLGGYDPTEFAFALKGIDANALSTLKVPSESAEIDGTSYVVMQPGEQEEAAGELFEAIQNDTLEQWAIDNPKWVNQSS